jgi:hypothetical protein
MTKRDFLSLFALGVLIVLVVRGFWAFYCDWDPDRAAVAFDAQTAAKQQKIEARLAHDEARDRDSFDDSAQYEAWKRYCALQLQADQAYSEADPVIYGIDGPPGPSEQYLRSQLGSQGEDSAKNSEGKSSADQSLAKKAAAQLEAQLLKDQIAEELKAGK